jgi:hypothetical protein
LIVDESVAQTEHGSPFQVSTSKEEAARTGGRGGIRTHGTLAGTPVFKTGALNHSATLPDFVIAKLFVMAQGNK